MSLDDLMAEFLASRRFEGKVRDWRSVPETADDPDDEGSTVVKGNPYRRPGGQFARAPGSGQAPGDQAGDQAGDQPGDALAAGPAHSTQTVAIQSPASLASVRQRIDVLKRRIDRVAAGRSPEGPQSTPGPDPGLDPGPDPGPASLAPAKGRHQGDLGLAPGPGPGAVTTPAVDPLGARRVLAKFNPNHHPAGSGRGGQFAPKSGGGSASGGERAATGRSGGGSGGKSGLPSRPKFVTSNAAVKAENEAHAAALEALAKAGDLAGVKAYDKFSAKSTKLAEYKAALVAALSGKAPGKSKPEPAAKPPKAAPVAGATTHPGWKPAADVAAGEAQLKALGVTVSRAGSPVAKAVQTAGKTPLAALTDDEFVVVMNRVGPELARLNERFPGIGKVVNLCQVRCHPGAAGVTLKELVGGKAGIPLPVTMYLGMPPVGFTPGKVPGNVTNYEPTPEEGYASIFRHELGHAVDYYLGKAPRDKLKTVNFEVGGKKVDTCAWGRANVSAYSGANNWTSEAIAEFFSLYTSPHYGKGGRPKLPGNVEQLIKRMASLETNYADIPS